MPRMTRERARRPVPALRRALGVGAAALGLVAVGACSSASTATVANVSGTYALSIVDGADACKLAGITQGTVDQTATLVVTQDSTIPQNVTATLGGGAGKTLATAAGTAVLTGTLGGQQITLLPEALDGGVAPTSDPGGCPVTTNATLTLSFAGDTVQGTLVYTLTPGANTTACNALNGCQTVQAIAGALTAADH